MQGEADGFIIAKPSSAAVLTRRLAHRCGFLKMGAGTDPAPEATAPLSERVQRAVDQVKPLLKNGRRTSVPPPAPAPAKLASKMANLKGALGAFSAEFPGYNIWTVAGLRRDEVRTTASLVALLNPSFNGPLANALMREVFIEAGGDLKAHPNEFAHYVVRGEHCFEGDRRTRLDIVIESERSIISIEAKIDAGEGFSTPHEQANEGDAPTIRETDAKQFARIVAATKRAAEARGKRAYVIVLSKKRVRQEAELLTLSWKGLARCVKRALRTEGDSTVKGYFLSGFGQHVQSL